ncbi:alkaline phosphatase family protein [Chloroflexota bacterium]
MTIAGGRVIVLGLDGATYDVLLPRVERGQMPNLAALLNSGVWGGLRSTIPPFSAQAWASMVTGKNPGKHGVVDFWERSRGEAPDDRRNFVSSRRLAGETLWQIVGRHGLKAGVVNVPVTYPPQAVSGFLVSGLLTPQGRDDFTYPLELVDLLRTQVPDYNPDPFDLLGTSTGQIATLLGWMEKHERVSRFLIDYEHTDLFFNVVQALDHLQHSFWDDIVDGSASGDGATLIDRCYQLADEIIGHRLRLLDEHTSLFVVSDHGFGPARKWFNVNRFLADRGLLTLAGTPGGAVSSLPARLGLTPEKLRSLVRRVDALGFRRWIFRQSRVTLGRKIDRALTLPVIWPETQAFSGSPATEGIYINLSGREPQGTVEPGTAYEALRGRLMAELLELKDPETGEPVVCQVYRREEIYEGPFVDLLPDLVFDLGDGPYLASDSLSAGQAVETLPADLLQGRHRSVGVLAATGAHIRSNAGEAVEGARIIDVAPTVLYALGLPLPDDMDGRPLLELFAEDFRSAQPVRYAPPQSATPLELDTRYDEQEAAEMERRLRGLGYMS